MTTYIVTGSKTTASKHFGTLKGALTYVEFLLKAKISVSVKVRPPYGSAKKIAKCLIE